MYRFNKKTLVDAPRLQFPLRGEELRMTVVTCCGSSLGRLSGVCLVSQGVSAVDLIMSYQHGWKGGWKTICLSAQHVDGCLDSLVCRLKKNVSEYQS